MRDRLDARGQVALAFFSVALAAACTAAAESGAWWFGLAALIAVDHVARRFE